MVKILNVKTRGTVGKVKAFFNISLGNLIINDLRLIDGPNGLFVGMPSRKYQDKEGNTKYSDIVTFPRDSSGELTESALDLKKRIFEAIVAAYEHRTGETIPAAASPDEDDDLPF